MKKHLLLVGVFAACMNCYAKDVEENDSEKLRNSYEGWYAGLGLNYQRMDNDILVNDNASSMQTNAGRSLGFKDTKNLNLNRSQLKKLGCSLLTGYGRFTKWGFYLGTEFTVDIAQNAVSDKNHQSTAGTLLSFGQNYTKVRGIVPTLAFRLGGLDQTHNLMYYMRVGGSMQRNDFKADSLYEHVNNRKVAPVIGVGVEKKLTSNLNLKVELDYRFKTKKEKNDIKAYYRDGEGNLTPFATEDNFDAKNYRASVLNQFRRGYNFRVTTSYVF